MQVSLKSLFPLYTLAEVHSLGCVSSIIWLELLRHLSLKTLTIPHMQSYLCLFKQSIKVEIIRQVRVQNLFLPLLFKEWCYLFVTSPFRLEDTDFFLASVKLPLSPVSSSIISYERKLVYCQDRECFKA